MKVDETVASVLLIFAELRLSHGDEFAVYFVREHYPQICIALLKLQG